MRIKVRGSQRQGIHHREAFTIIDFAAQRRRALTNRDTALDVVAADFNCDDAGAGLLPHAP